MSEYPFRVGVSLRLGEDPEHDEILAGLIASEMEHVEIGYAAYADAPDWTEAVRKTLAASAVNINSVHAPFSQDVDMSRLDPGGQEFALERIGKAIQVAQRLGAGIVVVHGSAEPIATEERAQRLAQSQESLRILGAQAEEAGVRLALELLPRTCLGNSADELQTLLAAIPPRQAGFCIDSNHLADVTQLAATVKQLGERVITLHISDYDGIDERHWMPFQGVVDWGGFANALRDIGYAGAFVYEVKLEGETIHEQLANVATNFGRILETAAE